MPHEFQNLSFVAFNLKSLKTGQKYWNIKILWIFRESQKCDFADVTSLWVTTPHLEINFSVFTPTSLIDM